MTPPNNAIAPLTVPARAVVQELERVVHSSTFCKAERCVRLLRYVTELTLEGRTHHLKEYALGLDVFGRPATYDPRTDPVVRLEARRLRLKLAEYYQQEGLDDSVVIELPKGAYIPKFRLRSAPAAAPEIERSAPTETDEAAISEHKVSATLPPPQARAAPGLGNGIGFIWIALAFVLVFAVAATLFAVRKRASISPTRTSIAVIGFNDLSQQTESSWISAAVSELLTIELGNEQRLRPLPLENVTRMRKELALTPQSAYSVQTLQRIGNNLGSDYVVSGAYLPRAGLIRVDVMLFDAHSGQQMAAISDESPEEKLPELTRRCADQIGARLGMRLAAEGHLPLEAAVIETYARGMEQLRLGNALSARVYLTCVSREGCRRRSIESLRACRFGRGLGCSQSGGPRCR